MNWINQKILGLFVKTNGIISKPLFGGIGHIFMLHRVLPLELKKKYTFNASLAITPEFLEEKIIDFREKGYIFISLNELHEILQKKRKPTKNFICFTIDDGYRDNISYGLPIFKKYEVPFTIYVTNCFPNRDAHLWWYWLEEKVKQVKKFTFEGKEYLCDSAEEELATFNELRDTIKNANQAKRKAYSLSFFNKSEQNIALELEKVALSWEELNALKEEPLLTIGAHTMHHLSLAHISSKELEYEIIDAKLQMEEKLNISIDHFAYPYGSLTDVNTKVIEIVRKAGFKTSTLNHVGNVFKDNSKALQTIPRYALGDSVSVERLNNYFNGITHFSKNKWKKTIQ